MKNIINLAKNKNFMNLWGSQLMTQLEASVVDFAILIYVTEVYNSVFATALIFALQYVPALGVSLIAGIIGDFYDRRKILIWTNIVRCGVLFFLVLTKSEAFWLYFLVLAFAVIMFVYSTAETATLKNVVKKDELITANMIFSITINATTLLGAVFASFLYKWLGGATQGGLEKIFIIGGVLFFLAAISAKFLPKNINDYEENIYVPKERTHLTFFKFIRSLSKFISQTLKFITSTPVIAISIVHSTILQAAMFAIASVGYKFAQDKLGVGVEGGSIYVIIPATLGLTLGAIFSSNLAKKRGARYPAILGTYVSGLAMGSLGLLTLIFNAQQIQGTLFWIVELCIVLMGFGATFAQLPAQSLIHEYADNEHRGRIFGILNGGTFTIAGLLVLLISPIGDLLGGVSQFFIILGLCAIIYVLILGRISKRFPKLETFSW